MRSTRSLSQFSRLMYAMAGLLLGWSPLASAQAEKPMPKPNILYIVADDLGWKDVGYHGSDIKTPNIDKLAQTGTRLEQFYAQPM